MKMKIVVILALCAILRSSAQEVTVNSTLANKYLAFGSGSVLHDKEVIQTGFDFRWEHFGVGGWSSLSPDNKSNFGDETDIKVSLFLKHGEVLGG